MFAPPSVTRRNPVSVFFTVPVKDCCSPGAQPAPPNPSYAFGLECIGCRQPAAIDTAVYAAYEGTYSLRSNFQVEISQEDGRLFAQGTQQAKVEFFPASETVFYNEITPMLLRFDSADEGVVRGFDALEAGRTRRAVRIP